MEKQNICKKKIYEVLNNRKGNIELVLNKFLTKEQTNEIINSLLDERNFLPNMLTLSRLPGIPLVYLSTFTGNPYLIALVLTVISLTDALDGYVARNITKNPNKGGALIDSCVDKLYTVSLIIPAVLEEPVLLLNGGFETAIGLINRDATKKGSEQASTKMGKLKMWPLSTIISLTYINSALKSSNLHSVISAGALLTLVLELINIFEYRNMAKNNLKKKKVDNSILINVDNMNLKDLYDLRDELVSENNEINKQKIKV